MKLYLRVHYGWLPKENTEGIPEFDNAIENALTPFGFQITGKNLDSGLRDLLFEADEFEIPANFTKTIAKKNRSLKSGDAILTSDPRSHL